MAGFLFYPPADAAQDGIWNDTVEQWGEAQAIRYITDLHKHLQTLSETPALWRKLPGNLAISADLNLDAYFSHHGRHYVFFRKLTGDRIGVISILHDRMDVPVRLAEDLQALAARSEDT
ncbi:type II toxin-antitoxin system RelE/ParE family toxin (plasmid) [Mesorhizobium sp. AR02]|uniref:type II toxin-antitoxin system RelE/ParE family toxin n=1 Tax=Mesorhizobium sp. AR02 TaxID=2865837 RepID=UPI00215F8841|nr:type II toxin-antitoxin system RelE/ParE family toxin [Mesorhizobium sp. AR02]UVK50256.1 type II toxin-antitoxin system RelE/ParE family toxin [Mesorhizobium sp. AR02]